MAILVNVFIHEKKYSNEKREYEYQYLIIYVYILYIYIYFMYDSR